MYRFLFSLTGLIFLTSCYGISDFQKSVDDSKLKGMPTGLEKRLRMDGIYLCASSADSTKGTFENAVIFYPDGTFMSLDIKTNNKEKLQENFAKAIHSAGYSKQKNRWNWDFGTYSMHGDTITAFHYYPNKFTFLPSSMYLYWMLDRYQFVITGKTTITAISRYFYLTDEEDYRQRMNDTIIANKDRYIFIPLDSLPSSDFRYKKKKWIWKDEESWNKYNYNKQ
jgi:hypothetical protein